MTGPVITPVITPPRGGSDLSAEVVSALIAEALEPLHRSMLAMQVALEARLPTAEARGTAEPRTCGSAEPGTAPPRALAAKAQRELAPASAQESAAEASEGKMGTMAAASSTMAASAIAAFAETQDAMESLRVEEGEAKMRKSPTAALITIWAQWWEALEEPPRAGWLFWLASSTALSRLSSSIILASTLFTAISADWEMQHLGEQRPMALEAVEWSFLGFFTLELLLRMAAHRAYFFINHDWTWNNFDFIVVGASLLGAVLEAVGYIGVDLAFVRILRFLKGARILRVLRVVRVFRALATIVESFRRCAVLMFWCFAALGFFLYIFALVFMSGVAELLSSPAGRELEVEEYMEIFGSTSRTMLELFKTISGGAEWSIIYGLLLPVGELYPAGFVAFIFLFIFALTNILTAIFVERAVEAAIPEREEQVLEKRREMIGEAAEFKKICKLVDRDKKGKISLDEFKRAMKNGVLVAYMASVGLEIHDVEFFFRSMAGSSEAEEVDVNAFVEGCMTMKGSATALDVQKQIAKTGDVFKRICSFEQSCNAKIELIMDRTDRLLDVVTGSKGHASSAHG